MTVSYELFLNAQRSPLPVARVHIHTYIYISGTSILLENIKEKRKTFESAVGFHLITVFPRPLYTLETRENHTVDIGSDEKHSVR